MALDERVENNKLGSLAGKVRAQVGAGEEDDVALDPAESEDQTTLDEHDKLGGAGKVVVEEDPHLDALSGDKAGPTGNGSDDTAPPERVEQDGLDALGGMVPAHVTGAAQNTPDERVQVSGAEVPASDLPLDRGHDEEEEEEDLDHGLDYPQPQARRLRRGRPAYPGGAPRGPRRRPCPPPRARGHRGPRRRGPRRRGLRRRGPRRRPQLPGPRPRPRPPPRPRGPRRRLPTGHRPRTRNRRRRYRSASSLDASGRTSFSCAHCRRGRRRGVSRINTSSDCRRYFARSW